MHDKIRRIVLYSLPPFIWMAVIFYFSTDRFSSAQTASRFEVFVNWVAPGMEESVRVLLHLLWRKLGHVTEYAVLAILWLRAFEKSDGRISQWQPRRRIVITLLLVAAYAFLDEWHQSLTATRTASIRDSLLDIGGGVLGTAIWTSDGLLKRLRD